MGIGFYDEAHEQWIKRDHLFGTNAHIIQLLGYYSTVKGTTEVLPPKKLDLIEIYEKVKWARGNKNSL